MLRLYTKNIEKTVSIEELNQLEEKALLARKTLVEKTGPGNDFVGWVEHPLNYDKEEFARIKKAAEQIKKDSQVLVVIGIGGSYLGAKAVIDAFKKYFGTNQNLEIVFVGNTLSSTYTKELLDYVQDKEFSINVMKNTAETSAVFFYVSSFSFPNMETFLIPKDANFFKVCKINFLVSPSSCASA